MTIDKQQSEQASQQESISRLFSSVKTLSLVPHVSQSFSPHSHAPEDALPKVDLSLVPFLFYEGAFWIFVSRLSSHTQHLLTNPYASILIYQNETPAKNCFAIERISATCKVNEQQDNRETILYLMTEKLGETVSLLRQLGDFHLFALTPLQGRYIAGFGQAFDVDFTDFSLQHSNPTKAKPQE